MRLSWGGLGADRCCNRRRCSLGEPANGYDAVHHSHKTMGVHRSATAIVTAPAQLVTSDRIGWRCPLVAALEAAARTTPPPDDGAGTAKIGRASCRERV